VTQDWLLVETLGDQPMVVAHGRQMKNFVPLAVFLRRNPNLAAIQSAITDTVTSAAGLASITPKTNRVIRTEPVAMSDGRIHAVHVWCGPPDEEPPERPIPGPLKFDVTLAEGTGTVEYFINAGMDAATEPTTGRALADDMPNRSLNADEAKALSWSIDTAPGRTYSTTWEFTDKQGTFRRVGWCARTMIETVEDGSGHLIARAMNLVEEVSGAPQPKVNLAQRILDGMSHPGVHRAIIDLNTWTPLKWIDDPCPYFNWRGRVQLHPEDLGDIAGRMREELNSGTTSAVLRLPGNDSDWIPLHVTISRVELDEGITGGLVSVRLPTVDELGAASWAEAGEINP
jgi:hypothetical protein